MSAAAPAAASGWLEAFGYVIAIGLLSLAYAVGHALGAHPIAFILYAMVASATATLAITGTGSDTVAIALYPMSWIVGAAIILVEILYYVTLAYVSPTHGNLLVRIGIPLAMLAGWAFLGRRPPALALIGGAIIVAATGYVVMITDAAVRWPAATAGALAGFFMVVRGFTGEYHRWNRAAHGVSEKLRVTGTLLLVTSLMSLALVALAAIAIAATILPPLRFVPTGAELLHVPTILLGAFGGGVILVVMNYLSFSSVVKIQTQNLTAMMAFSPIATWAFQELGVAVGLIEVTRPEPRLLAAMATFIAAVMLIFWAGRRARNRRVPDRHPGNADRVT
jgi:hypothetical protein